MHCWDGQHKLTEAGLVRSATFCELTARRNFAKSDDGSVVPRKIDLYWFIPAFANRRVGSECGTTEEDGTARLLVSHIPASIDRIHPTNQRYARSS